MKQSTSRHTPKQNKSAPTFSGFKTSYYQSAVQRPPTEVRLSNLSLALGRTFSRQTELVRPKSHEELTIEHLLPSYSAQLLDYIKIEHEKDAAELEYQQDRGLANIDSILGEQPGQAQIFLAGKTVLDVGAGFGNIAKQASGANVFSLDIQAHDNSLGKSVQAEASILPFSNGTFDATLSTYCMPFWAPSPQYAVACVDEIDRVLKPGGKSLVLPLITGMDEAYMSFEASCIQGIRDPVNEVRLLSAAATTMRYQQLGYSAHHFEAMLGNQSLVISTLFTKPSESEGEL
jgi:SAM-dependent methyltransferase